MGLFSKRKTNPIPDPSRERQLSAGSPASSEVVATDPAASSAVAQTPVSPPGFPFILLRRQSYGRRKYDPLRVMFAWIAAVTGIGLTLYMLHTLAWALLPCAIVVTLAYLLYPIAAAYLRVLRWRLAAVGLTILTVGAAVGLLGWRGVPLAARQLHLFADQAQQVWVEIQKTIPVPIPGIINRLPPPPGFILLFHKELPLFSGQHNRDVLPPPDHRRSRIDRPDMAAAIHQRTAWGWAEFTAEWNRYLSDPSISRRDFLRNAYDATDFTYLGTVFDHLASFVNERNWNATINSLIEEFLPHGTAAAVRLTLLTLLIGFVIVLLIHLVLAVHDAAMVGGLWHKILNRQHRPPSVQWLVAFGACMDQFLIRQAVAAIGMMVISSAAFHYIGLPIPLILGLFIGLLSMIPYLHLVGIGPVSLFAVFQALYAREPLTPLLLGILATFLVLQLYHELVAKPWIVGRTPRLERIAMLLGVLFWPKLMGWPGFFFVIPGTCAILAWYRMRTPETISVIDTTPPARPLPAVPEPMPATPSFSGPALATARETVPNL